MSEELPETEEERRLWSRRALEWSLRALACPIDEQLRIFGPEVCAPCELALTYDDSSEPFLALHPELEADRRAALKDLLARFDDMPAPECPSIGPKAELEKPGWQALREAAARALALFGWPAAPPKPPTRLPNGAYRWDFTGGEA